MEIALEVAGEADEDGRGKLQGKIVIILDWYNGREWYNITKRTKYIQSLVSLWPPCKVWNTATILCARHQDTESGQE